MKLIFWLVKFIWCGLQALTIDNHSAFLVRRIIEQQWGIGNCCDGGMARLGTTWLTTAVALRVWLESNHFVADGASIWRAACLHVAWHLRVPDSMTMTWHGRSTRSIHAGHVDMTTIDSPKRHRPHTVTPSLGRVLGSKSHHYHVICQPTSDAWYKKNGRNRWQR